MTNAIAVFPDVVALVIDHLRPLLSPVPIGTRVSNPIEETFVKVHRTGGERTLYLVDSVQLTFECWAPFEEDAFDLCSLVRTQVLGLRGQTLNGHAVYKIEEFAGPTNEPDDLSDSPRFTYTAIVPVRAQSS